MRGVYLVPLELKLQAASLLSLIEEASTEGFEALLCTLVTPRLEHAAGEYEYRVAVGQVGYTTFSVDMVGASAKEEAWKHMIAVGLSQSADGN